MTEYVVGFALSENLHTALLLRKTKPSWQAGRLNGPGGKIEAGETPLEAMNREFQEETGLTNIPWKHTVTYSGPGYRVFFFFALTNDIYQATTQTEEPLVWSQWKSSDGKRQHLQHLLDHSVKLGSTSGFPR